MAHPVLTGGVTTFAVLFACVAGNAFYDQPFRHPKPLLVTRLAAVGAAGGQEAQPAGPPSKLVKDVQAALAQAGRYSAPIDGVPGAATDAAIKDFQHDRGLAEDGKASPQLLTQIRQMLAAAASKDGSQYASLPARMGSDVTGAIASRPAAPAVSADKFAGLPESELVRRIQAGLSSAQVAKLDVDGVPGEQTRSAIRTFQALEGLDVNGTPSPEVLARLVQIGAVN